MSLNDIDLLKWIKDLQSSTILFVDDWCALIDQDVMINHETCLASTTPETCTFGQVSRLGDAVWKFMIAMIHSPKINRIASQKWKKVVGFDYPWSYPILLEWSLLMGRHSFIFPLPGLDLSKHAAFHAVGILGKEWIFRCDRGRITGAFFKTPLVSVVVPFGKKKYVYCICIFWKYI